MLIMIHLAIALREKRRGHSSTTTTRSGNIGREEILPRDTVHMMNMSIIEASVIIVFRITSKAISESTRPWCRHDPVGMLMELIWWLHDDTLDWVNE